MMQSKKRPLWLMWRNPDAMADIAEKDIKLMFKNGDGENSLRLCARRERDVAPC